MCGSKRVDPCFHGPGSSRSVSIYFSVKDRAKQKASFDSTGFVLERRPCSWLMLADRLLQVIEHSFILADKYICVPLLVFV